MRRLTILFSLAISCLIIPAHAHDLHPDSATAEYIANEGVLITQGESKIMFDPLPLSGFGTYMDVSADQKSQMMAGTTPYDGIDAVFISHAHRDHFSAKDMIDYMNAQPDVKLVAPEQAIAMMRADDGWNDNLTPRIVTLNLDFMSPPETIDIGDIKATAVHIPHSGWPGLRRAKIQNMIFRVTLGDGATIIHMGDADVRRQHYTPYKKHWEDKRTDMAFPPYWFLLSQAGKDILYQDMNVDKAIGTHVPLVVPVDLKNSDEDYFSERGETRDITKANKDELKFGCRETNVEANIYSVCIFHPMKHDVHFFHKNSLGQVFGNFENLSSNLKLNKTSLAFAVNGGMFHPDYNPVGLYIENFNSHTPLNTQDGEGNFFLKPNGVFWIWAEDGLRGARIATTQDYEDKAAKDVIKYATQSGPILVSNGVIHPSFNPKSTSKRIRNGVGIGNAGELIFVKSETPVTFHTFAQFYKLHLKTPNALYLDGVISQLYDAKTNRHDKGVRLGPIIGVTSTTTP